jgi:hypothetical protein
MPRLKKRQAASWAGISPTSLYKLIDAGLVLVQADGTIDTDDLPDAVSTLRGRLSVQEPSPRVHEESSCEHHEHLTVHNEKARGHDEHTRSFRERQTVHRSPESVHESASQGVHASQSVHEQEHVHQGLMDTLRQERDFYQRAYEQLRQELEATKAEYRQEREETRGDLWELRKALTDEREAIRHEREVYREQQRIALLDRQRLWDLIEATAQEKRLLLEAPRPTVGVPYTRPQAIMPEMWQRILAYIQEHGPQTAPQVQAGLGLEENLAHRMKRMASAGYLERVARGVYGAPGHE